MTDVFTLIANAFMAWVGGTPSTSCYANQDCGQAGFLLGIVVIILLSLAMWALLGEFLGTKLQGFGMLLPPFMLYGFVVLVGWWPLWTLILFALFLAFLIVGPFRGGGSGGGEG